MRLWVEIFCTFSKNYNMKLILKLLLSALAVFILAHVLPGVHVDGYTTAIIVSVVLSLLNLFIKPILVIFTLPITVLTLGLFLLIINALIILLAGNLIDGFSVSSIWTAILFSILLSFLESILYSLLKEDKI
jgi:putative membrane protein